MYDQLAKQRKQLPPDIHRHLRPSDRDERITGRWGLERLSANLRLNVVAQKTTDNRQNKGSTGVGSSTPSLDLGSPYIADRCGLEISPGGQMNLRVTAHNRAVLKVQSPRVLARFGPLRTALGAALASRLERPASRGISRPSCVNQGVCGACPVFAGCGLPARYYPGNVDHWEDKSCVPNDRSNSIEPRDSSCARALRLRDSKRGGSGTAGFRCRHALQWLRQTRLPTT